MNYKLLMEGWRKFLNEQPYNKDRGLRPTVAQMKAAAEIPPTAMDHGFGGMDFHPAAFSSVDAIDFELPTDESFPIVNEKNFLMPISGVPGSHRGADFNEPRGKLKHKGGKHAGWDQWVPVGTPVQAPADGVITRTILAGKGMDYATIAFIRKLHSLRKKGVDLGISSLPPLSIKSWNQLRTWNKKFAPWNALASLIRNRSDLSIPPNGKGLILKTFPDQHGTTFKFIFSHMDKVTASKGLIKAGDPLGTTGTTGIFDSDPHLHFEILVSESNPFIGRLPGSLSKNPGSSKVGQIDPIRVIPSLKGAKKNQGTYVNQVVNYDSFEELPEDDYEF